MNISTTERIATQTFRQISTRKLIKLALAIGFEQQLPSLLQGFNILIDPWGDREIGTTPNIMSGCLPIDTHHVETVLIRSLQRFYYGYAAGHDISGHRKYATTISQWSFRLRLSPSDQNYAFSGNPKAILLPYSLVGRLVVLKKSEVRSQKYVVEIENSTHP